MDDPPDDGGTTTPDAAAPDASTPDASTPDASAPEASTPEASTPDASAPDASTPEASTPEASTPDAATPDASMADAATPDAAAPDAAAPDTAAPDTAEGQPTLTDAHCDWIKQMCGKDPREADQNGADPGGASATDPDASNQTGAPPDGSGSPIPGSSQDETPLSAASPAENDGGATGAPSDGPGDPRPETKPDGSQPTPAVSDDAGGAPGATPDGDGSPAPGAAPAPSADPAPGATPAAPADADKAAREKIAKDNTSGDPTTNADDVKLVNDEIVKTVPLKELEALKAAGVKVKVTTGGVATYKPSLNANLPRGHTDTFSTVAGVYLPDSKEVVVATHAGADGKRELPGQKQSSSADVVAHEMAHAYNATGKDADGKAEAMSEQDDFKDAYKDETKTGHLADPYYHQKGFWGFDSAGGRDEGFAESNAMYRTDPEGMKTTYPKLYAYWNKKLGK